MIKNLIDELGPSVMTRVLARMHEAPKYFRNVQRWLKRTRPARGVLRQADRTLFRQGFQRHRGRAGALCDWIVLEDGKIANYQVITPTGWNIGPRDANDNIGPMEQSFIGNSIENPDFPVELGQVATASTPAWSARCTPATARPASSCRSSAWVEADRLSLGTGSTHTVIVGCGT